MSQVRTPRYTGTNLFQRRVTDMVKRIKAERIQGLEQFQGAAHLTAYEDYYCECQDLQCEMECDAEADDYKYQSASHEGEERDWTASVVEEGLCCFGTMVATALTNQPARKVIHNHEGLKTVQTSWHFDDGMAAMCYALNMPDADALELMLFAAGAHPYPFGTDDWNSNWDDVLDVLQLIERKPEIDEASKFVATRHKIADDETETARLRWFHKLTRPLP